MKTKIQFTRQTDIVSSKKLNTSSISIIGAGAVNSFAAMSLAKMGANKLTVYDEDGVSAHNLPNQFFAKDDIGRFKVDALRDILLSFTDVNVNVRKAFYEAQPLEKTVIVATDSMSSRKLVWEQFKKQKRCHTYIEARMGAELGCVYTICKNGKGKIDPKDIKFYESMLYDDSRVTPLPCTARSIIYNVLMISSLICRSFKGIIMGEKVPKELIFNMTSLDERSFMLSR